ncbi:Lipase [Tetrabaena socialis]|uniref:Lipase n=1 Tax=Tetrabaena socialis TaxID=47790 RepID=A0A2J8AG40_9CHLO|nr:Lipase [Tetrabaena socialis]|eukprot:PNH11480.1 Lipase [Tetrabaena socialis]
MASMRMMATFTAAIAELLAAHPGSRLVAVGHSMGGALAQLAGLEAKLLYNATHTSVFTFGCPRVGNLAYQELFNSFIDISWRFTHNRDIVPSVPMQLMGFHHVAREVWEVDVEDPSIAGGVERKLLMCDGTGEDPSCHNSACYLGLCTSVADHLVYLGLHMYQDDDEC